MVLLAVHTPSGLIQRPEEAPTGIEDPSGMRMRATHGESQPCARSCQQGHIQGPGDTGDAEALAVIAPLFADSRTPVSNILTKLGPSSRTKAARWAVRTPLADGADLASEPGTSGRARQQLALSCGGALFSPIWIGSPTRQSLVAKAALPGRRSRSSSPSRRRLHGAGESVAASPYPRVAL